MGTLASPAKGEHETTVTRETRITVMQAMAAAGLSSTGAIMVRWARDLSAVAATSLRLLPGGLWIPL
ncbi:MAG TPA: hypothetical protein VN648_27070, partial [Candidatus Methylomirabilis sp.]|nr:hypothetical protein [Candidatus Methylomirabilis sp.]